MSEEKNLFDKKFVYLEWDDVLEGKEVFLADALAVLKRAVTLDFDRYSVEKNDGAYPFTSPEGIHYSMAYYDPNLNCKLAYARGEKIQCRHIECSTWSDCTVPPSWLDDCEYRVKPEELSFYVYRCNDDTLHISKFGMQLEYELKGTEEECKQYIKEHYCGRCSHQSCDVVAGTQFCKGFKEVKKRRMTNRELAKWLAQGNGECTCEEGMVIDIMYGYCENREDVPCDDGTLIRGWDETEWHEPEVEV